MAQSRNLRLRWAQKVLRAQHFVVLTDKESVIALAGVDPKSFTDLNMLREQSVSLQNFMYQIQDLVQEHDEAINILTGGGSGKKAPRKSPKAKSVKRKEK